MSRLNTDLMLQIREQITSHPETHDQGIWAARDTCGTTYCIAGWAIALSGLRLDWIETEDGFDIALTAMTDNGSSAVETLGQKLLGLTDYETLNLFYETGDHEALVYLDRLIEKGKNES